MVAFPDVAIEAGRTVAQPDAFVLFDRGADQIIFAIGFVLVQEQRQGMGQQFLQQFFVEVAVGEMVGVDQEDAQVGESDD